MRLCHMFSLMVLSVIAKWTKQESEDLMQAVKEIVIKHKRSKTGNIFCNIPWTKIAAKFRTKTHDQCRNHWLVNTPATWLVHLLITCYTAVFFQLTKTITVVEVYILLTLTKTKMKK